VPAPTGLRVVLVIGDSISVGYQFDSALAPFELIRGTFDGQFVMFAAGGSALESYGWVGDGAGALSMTPQNVAKRAAFTARVLALNLQPTELLVQVCTNDWGGHVSADDHRVGCEALLAWWASAFPGRRARLQHPIQRTSPDGTLPDGTSGSTLDPDYKVARATAVAAFPSFASVYSVEPPGRLAALSDGTHAHPANPDGNPMIVAETTAELEAA
jgi:hypothetical protein